MTIDVVIIGAGPASAVAGSLLARRGHRVVVYEQQRFPRFSIGESLLPQAMVWIEAAGLMGHVEAERFQTKDGAVFRHGERERVIRFADKSAAGPHVTWQVRRERFDLELAEGAREAGVALHFGRRVTAFRPGDLVSLTVEDEEGRAETVEARFVLDASGFARVLARLLDLDRPGDFPARAAVFTHVEAGLVDARFDRQKILISVNPADRDIWYWLIPFRNGLASIGAVGPIEAIDAQGASDAARLDRLVAASGFMAEILGDCRKVRPVGRIDGYSRSASRLTGPGYALLGNAAEFLDPIFSSGVTIAMKSGSLAADVLDRQLRGETVDWVAEYEAPLTVGIDAFRAYVEAWYDHSLQDIIFDLPMNEGNIPRMVVSMLAGYAWDEANPFVTNPKKYLGMLSAMR